MVVLVTDHQLETVTQTFDTVHIPDRYQHGPKNEQEEAAFLARIREGQDSGPGSRFGQIDPDILGRSRALLGGHRLDVGVRAVMVVYIVPLVLI